MTTTENEHFFVEIQPAFAGVRVDKALSALLPEHSRATIQQWLKHGLVLVDGEQVKQKFSLGGGETVEISVPVAQPTPAMEQMPAQQMELDIVHQDADLLVINKPAGMVVHPGAGRRDNTMLNGLLYFDPALRTLPRAGIVHRLDMDTSGLLVVARTEVARQRLSEQLLERGMKRSYLAVVNGVMVAGERIDQPIGRHQHDRLRMCVTRGGKPAVTHIRVERKFRRHCLVRAELETGRTHQIRVHLQWRGFPLVGDKLYGGRARAAPESGGESGAASGQFGRQALHAEYLSFLHPANGEKQGWRQPAPDDLKRLLDQLEDEHRRYGGGGR